jgi:DNA-binding transcriptional regulator YhcF (GntR family)
MGRFVSGTDRGQTTLFPGLDAIDVNILMHLASHWWTPDNAPHPSKKKIAAAMNVDPRTVQRRIAAMESSGFIKREERRRFGLGSLTNRYHFAGLIAAATPYAKEKLQEIEQRAAELQATTV